MRIDDIETGAEYTDDRTHYARDVRPRRYRADAIETRDATRRRAQRVVMLTELDPETGDVIPEGVAATGGRLPQTSRTGGWLRASDLEPYGPARANWEAYQAAYTEVADLAQALRSHLVDAEIRPRVYGPYRASGRGLEARLDLILSPEVARRLVAGLERLASEGWDIGQEVVGP